VGNIRKSLFLKMERTGAGCRTAALCASGILLCVQCTIELAPLAVVFNGLVQRFDSEDFDSDDYAGAAAAVGST
jgi:hypothetical protein